MSDELSEENKSLILEKLRSENNDDYNTLINVSILSN